MNFRTFIFQLFLLLLLSGCSSDSFERTLYESNRNFQKEQCKKELSYPWPEMASFDQYQKQREELLRDND
ncbi:MAG: hypothetical protein IIA62_02785 [Nitrospinae bacterium]|nr:hypothetical protein [Nitrospinota bacterium]